MGKSYKVPKQLEYKKPFAGISEEDYTALLENRLLYSNFYYTCFVWKRQRLCGPKFENGTRIDGWKKRERVFKHFLENQINQHLSESEKVSFEDNIYRVTRSGEDTFLRQKYY